jgi:hypothetical protein
MPATRGARCQPVERTGKARVERLCSADRLPQPDSLYRCCDIVKADDLDALRDAVQRERDRPAEPLADRRIVRQGADHLLAADPDEQRHAKRVERRDAPQQGKVAQWSCRTLFPDRQ